MPLPKFTIPRLSGLSNQTTNAPVGRILYKRQSGTGKKTKAKRVIKYFRREGAAWGVASALEYDDEDILRAGPA